MHERRFEFSISSGSVPEQQIIYPTIQPIIQPIGTGYVQQQQPANIVINEYQYPGGVNPGAVYPPPPYVQQPNSNIYPMMNNTGYAPPMMNTVPMQQYPAEYNTNIIVQNPPGGYGGGEYPHHHHHRHGFSLGFESDRY